MSHLAQEIDHLIDTLPQKERDDLYVEVDFKDRGSTQAALVALTSCGKLVAEKRAQQRLAESDVPEKLRDIRFGTLQKEELHKIHDVQEAVVGGFGSSRARGMAETQVRLSSEKADLLVEAMEMAVGTPPEQQSDIVNYYHAVIPHLLSEAGISVDGDTFRYTV